MKISKRVFVSFDELCPYECKFCYTYGIKREKNRTAKEIVDSISDDEFDIIYVSQKNDNFSNPLRGIELCNMLFERYNSNLFIITRNVFTDIELKELEKLKIKMQNNNRKLFISISLNATDSIDICEDVNKVPSPEERISFIKRLYNKNFMPILMLRPIFPNNIIPVNECLQIINLTNKYISCVVSSGLGVNNDVLNRLGKKVNDFSYNINQEYLQGAINCEIKFVNVDSEIEKIRQQCYSLNIPMFEHSMPALNYVAEKFI